MTREEDQKWVYKNSQKSEYILCAAVKRLKPVKVKAHNYQTINQHIDDIYSIEIGRRHNDILARFGKLHLDATKQSVEEYERIAVEFLKFVDNNVKLKGGNEC